MEGKRRERAANFNAEEVHLLLNLVAKFKGIVENKKTDAATNKDKENAWKKIENSFNSCELTSYVRSWKTLKLKYEGIKKSTKKKLSFQRQDLYKTGGASSKASTFNELEEKILNICNNMEGFEARHESDTVSSPITVMQIISEPSVDLYSSTEQLETQSSVEDENPLSATDESTSFELMEDNNTQKENKWDQWHPRALKTRVSNVLESNVSTKPSITSQLDKLSAARLELLQLQIETARKEQQFLEEEHKLKMLHLANDERRKEEIHVLLLKKNKASLNQIG